MAQARDAATGRFVASGGGGGGFNLGTAYGAVVIDASGVSRAMSEASNAIGRGISGIGERISGIGESFSRIGGALTTFSAPIAAIGGVGLKSAADFDELLKQIEIFGNVAPDQLKTVSDFALQMGADTKFSSGDAAAALLDLLKSGQSLEQAMATLPDVLNLAAVGNMGLAEAAGIVSSGLSIYQLKATDAARVSNALARAANASRADVRDLGQAMTAVGGVSAQYGLSIEDTAAALAIFSQNGVMGSEAGTALKSVLLNMHRPTQDVKDALGALGLNLYDAQGNARNFNDILKDLDGALDKLPVEKQNELMQTLGGSYGIVGLSALRAASGLDNMKQQMQAAPAAVDVASSFMETLKGKIESATGSIETLMVSALTPFMDDVLAPLVDRFIEVVNGITAWVQANPELTKQIVSVLGVVAVLGPALLIAGAAFNAVGDIVNTIGAAIGFLTSPIGLVIAAVAALAVAYFTNFGGIRDFIDTQVRPVIDQFIATLGAIWAMVQPGLQSLYDWFVNTALPAVVLFIEDTVIPGVNSFVDLLKGIWETVSPFLSQLADWFLNTALPSIVLFIQNTVMPGIQAFVDILEGIWRVIEPGLTSLNQWFTETALPAISTAVTDFQTNIITPLSTLLSGLWNAVKPGLEGIYNWFRDSFQWIGTNFVQPVINTINDIITKAGQALDWLRQLGGGAPAQSSADIVNRGLPPNLRGGIPFRDVGGMGAAGQAYRIGSGQMQNEVYIPGADGQFVAGFVDLMKSVAARQNAGIGAINVQMPSEALASPAVAEARGRDFGAALAQELYARGIVGGIN